MKKGLLFLLLTSIVFRSIAQKEWKDRLPKGIRTAGFRQLIVTDISQDYPYFIDTSLGLSKRYPKPLLVNIWYPTSAPATSKKMVYQDYFSVKSPSKKLEKWLKNYLDYTRNTIASEVLGGDLPKYNETEIKRWQTFLQQKTNLVKDAPAAIGKFPLIIYHQGAGASFEDNSILCEMLAEHGYVVITSSNQRSDGDFQGVGGTLDGLLDITFLLKELRQFPFIDFSRVGMAGHSLGAQTANYIAARGNVPIDAMVCLETTQEYFTDRTKLWDYFVPFVSKGADLVKGDILFATDPGAVHELADKMINANRYYLTIPEISHNDYISQGLQHRFEVQLQKKDSASIAKYNKVLSDYTQLSTTILHFLNAKLKGETKDWEPLLTNQHNKIGHGFFYESLLARKKMEDYVNSISYVSPRQIRFYLQSKQFDKAIGLIKNTWTSDPKHPIYNNTFSFSMIEYVLSVDTPNAIKLYNTYTSLLGDSIVDTKFVSWGKLISRIYSQETGKEIHNRLYILNPGNREKVIRLLEPKK